MTTAHHRSELPAASEQVCPYLGVEEDCQTCLGYASPWNLCHHCRPAASVRLGHQRKMCLSPAHTGCPVFQNMDMVPLPMHLRVRQRQAVKTASRGR